MKITVTDALREGNWSYLSWSPRVADETAFQAFIGGLAARAAAYVEWRVGLEHYSDPAEPKASVLKEAEMHVCQEQILLSAAAVAEAARDAATPPFLATGPELRAEAARRRDRAEEILAPYDQGFQRRLARPDARAGAGTPPLGEYRFDEKLGRIANS